LPNYDWLLVRQEDKDHPPVHVTVRAVGHDGRRLVANVILTQPVKGSTLKLGGTAGRAGRDA